MADREKLKKKLQTALKLGGFNVRREFSSLIVDKFAEKEIDLNDIHQFEQCIKNLITNLETQDISEKSIEQEHINGALEVCLHSGYDKYETTFNVISAFDFPKLEYNLDRKHYLMANRKSTFLSDPDSKAQLFRDRYESILRRTKRNFEMDIVKNSKIKFTLKTVDVLLTSSHVTLADVLILGCLVQVSEGNYYLEDPTGMVQLNLTNAKFHGGFFVENIFVMVNGQYEDKILTAAIVILPPGEEYKHSRSEFGTLNYFGGLSSKVLKDSKRLQHHLITSKSQIMLFFSDVWLDHPNVFEKLEILFNGFKDSPPIAFVFMGNFLSQLHENERLSTLKRLFKKFAQLIATHENLIARSSFVFVPGMEDPCTPHIIPRLPLPSCLTEEVTRVCPKAIFTTNPCRIQYCTKEITVFRTDIQSKCLQGTLFKPPKDEISANLARTILSQGHLAPFSLNSIPVHWDFDYTLHVYPAPDLIVIGDQTEPYESSYKETYVINPGSFCDSDFHFKSYIPANSTFEDCVL